MLHIIDINTNSTNQLEVEQLKKEFSAALSETVHEGSLIIVSNFPATGNIQGRLDYLIIFWCKEQHKNYLRREINGKYQYAHSFIYFIRKIKDDNILQADDQFFYTEHGMFDYLESLRSLTYEFEDYASQLDKIKCYGSYFIETSNNLEIQNPYISFNTPVRAEFIINSAIRQSLNRFGDIKTFSFTKNKSVELNHDSLNLFIQELIASANEATKFGILTKRKIDRITTSTKTIDEIYDNLGNSISIIKGKAGTGKTLTLTRLIHKHVSGGHNVRFLTFNHLLVFDIKQNLRNFAYYGDNRINVATVHNFFYKLASKLGVSLLLATDRVNSLLNTCALRIEKMRNAFLSFHGSNDIVTKAQLLKVIGKNKQNEIDIEEFHEFAEFIEKAKDQQSFDKIKTDYLKYKRQLLEPKIGKQIFLEDYYKVLELIHEAITDGKTFYDKWDIKSRYELLAKIYEAHKFTSEKEISFENFNKQLSNVAKTTKWSTLIIVDESQDFHVLEKEILFHLRGPENFIVASGGKEQLIRHPNVLDWSVSWSKPIPSKSFNLSGGSYRQKQNIITFVNRFAELYGMKLDLKSVAESKGLGKIIIDVRSKEKIIRDDIAVELMDSAIINECSLYEGLMVLIPSKHYTSRKMVDSFVVNDKDYVRQSETSVGRQASDLDYLKNINIKGWDGVSENKGSLRIPNQNEIRIIHYESCRGLEAWCCACMSMDSYFKNKRASNDAKLHLSDDLFLEEETRRDYYAAIWCLMAFTRPIDTLYIHLQDPTTNFSQRILSLAKSCDGVTFIE